MPSMRRRSWRSRQYRSSFRSAAIDEKMIGADCGRWYRWRSRAGSRSIGGGMPNLRSASELQNSFTRSQPNNPRLISDGAQHGIEPVAASLIRKS